MFAGWAIFIGYVVVGVWRMPSYYELAQNMVEREYSYGYKRDESAVSCAWLSLGMGVFWPITEAYRGFKRVILWYLLKGDAERRLLEDDKIIERARDILSNRGKTTGH